MRNPKRVPKVLKRFQELWEQHPDMRFGQLVKCIFTDVEVDMFYREDKDFLKDIEAFEQKLKRINDERKL